MKVRFYALQIQKIVMRRNIQLPIQTPCPAPIHFDLFVFGIEHDFVNDGRLCADSNGLPRVYDGLGPG